MNEISAYALLVMTSLLTSAGQLCQKQAAVIWGRTASRPERLQRVTGWLLLAAALLGAGMVSWLFVLRVLPVSQAYPMLSINFAVVALGARCLFGENASPRQWLGLAVIMLGVALLGVGL